jgi:hypothetical protein
MSLSLDDVSIAEVHTEYVDDLIAANHYLDRVPSPATKHRYLITGGIMEGVIGGAMWGKPVARMEDQETTLELFRFYTDDRTPKNTESYTLSRMIRHIDNMYDYDRLISYASTGQDHNGGIYRATNWTDQGVRKTTSGDGWANRDGRVSADPTPKRKFEYLLE